MIPICYQCHQTLTQEPVHCKICERIPFCSEACEKIDVHALYCTKPQGECFPIETIFQEAIAYLKTLSQEVQDSFTKQASAADLKSRHLVTLWHCREQFLYSSHPLSIRFKERLDEMPTEDLEQKLRILKTRIGFAPRSTLIRLLSKLHLLAKIALFGIFVAKFFDHVLTHALKILQQICTKIANFIKQSEFRKKSIVEYHNFDSNRREVHLFKLDLAQYQL